MSPFFGFAYISINQYYPRALYVQISGAIHSTWHVNRAPFDKIVDPVSISQMLSCHRL